MVFLEKNVNFQTYFPNGKLIVFKLKIIFYNFFLIFFFVKIYFYLSTAVLLEHLWYGQRAHPVRWHRLPGLIWNFAQVQITVQGFCITKRSQHSYKWLSYSKPIWIWITLTNCAYGARRYVLWPINLSTTEEGTDSLMLVWSYSQHSYLYIW